MLDTPLSIRTQTPHDARDELGEPRDCLAFYRQEAQYEFDVLSSKVSNFLKTQSCLIITFGLCMLNANPQWAAKFTLVMPVALSLFGVVLSFNALPSILSSHATLLHWQAKQGAMLRRLPPTAMTVDGNPILPRWEERTNELARALLYARLAPIACGVFWVLVGGYTLAIQML